MKICHLIVAAFVLLLPVSAFSEDVESIEEIVVTDQKRSASVQDIPLSVSVVSAETPRVLIIGVFHFSNPKQDNVKVDQIDVTDTVSQQYLQIVAKRFAAFRPTKILQEFHPEHEAEINEDLQSYLNGKFKLPVTEVHQLGFRIARESNLDQLYGMDEPGPLMKFGELHEYMTKDDTQSLEQFHALLADITEKDTKAHAELTLEQLLIRTNELEGDRENMSIYLSTNHVGAGDGFIGADSSATWWNRNFRMYANIQKHAEPGSRLIVIAGGGHTAILRNLAEIDTNMIVEDVLPYLQR